jgi:hypothetical protein
LVTALSVLTATALLIAVAALLRARRLARRLEHVIESYWELRYDYGQLRAQIERFQAPPQDRAESEAGGATAFVPLSSIRRT